MASELTVQTLRGPTSGANANKVLIPSGHSVITEAGGLVAPGMAIQTQHMTYATNTTNSTVGSWVDSGLTLDITVGSGNKLYVTANIASGQLYNSTTMGLYQRLLVNDTEISNCHWEENASGYKLRNHFILGFSSALTAGTYTVKCQTYVVLAGTYFRYNWTNVGQSWLVAQEIAQ